MFSSFQPFFKGYIQHLPKVALIGMSYEQDQDVCWDLLRSDEIIDQRRVIFEARKSEGLSVAQITSLFDEYQLFPVHKCIGFFSVEKMPEETKKVFDYCIKCLSTSQSNAPHFLSVLLWTKDRATFSHYEKLLQTNFSLNCFGEKKFDRNQRKIDLLIRKANAESMQCTPNVALHFLHKFPQFDNHSILNEFQKLLCFLGKKEIISISDVDYFVQNRQVKSSIWKLRDAIFTKNSIEGIRLMTDLIETSQEHPLKIIEFLRSQCRFGLQAFDSQNLKENYIFIAYGKNALMQSLNSLFYTELLLKQNKQTPLVAMHMLVIRMTRDVISSS